jgi:hypothetical protein
VNGSPAAGYTLQIDGPLSLHTATTKYGLQIALFLPSLLHITRYHLEAELRWGPKRQPARFVLSESNGPRSSSDFARSLPTGTCATRRNPFHLVPMGSGCPMRDLSTDQAGRRFPSSGSGSGNARPWNDCWNLSPRTVRLDSCYLSRKGYAWITQ